MVDAISRALCCFNQYKTGVDGVLLEFYYKIVTNILVLNIIYFFSILSHPFAPRLSTPNIYKYIYTYILYIHIYTYIYIHTCTHNAKSWNVIPTL
ncbi:hypothetical protein FKM82_025504 [Ascaphus truei]